MITAVTRSSPYPDQMITAVTRSSPYPDQMITGVTRSSPYPDQMITAVTRSSPYPDQMITAVTRSSPYPDQMITAVTRSSPYPDQMITAVTRSSPYPDQMITGVTRSSPYPDQMITAVTRSSPYPDQMITAVTRSSPYPDQMITAVTRSSPYPDQMMDQHLEMTSTALNVSRDQDTYLSPRDRSPVRTSSPGHPSGKDHWNQWSPYNLTLLQLEQTTDSSGRRGTAPPTEPGFSQGFFSVLSPMEFWFLAVVASGLLSRGHFIYSDIIDLIAQIVFKLNWAGWWHHWIQ